MCGAVVITLVARRDVCNIRCEERLCWVTVPQLVGSADMTVADRLTVCVFLLLFRLCGYR